MFIQTSLTIEGENQQPEICPTLRWNAWNMELLIVKTAQRTGLAADIYIIDTWSSYMNYSLLHQVFYYNTKSTTYKSSYSVNLHKMSKSL